MFFARAPLQSNVSCLFACVVKQEEKAIADEKKATAKKEEEAAKLKKQRADEERACQAEAVSAKYPAAFIWKVSLVPYKVFCM